MGSWSSLLPGKRKGKWIVPPSSPSEEPCPSNQLAGCSVNGMRNEEYREVMFSSLFSDVSPEDEGFDEEDFRKERYGDDRMISECLVKIGLSRIVNGSESYSLRNWRLE